MITIEEEALLDYQNLILKAHQIVYKYDPDPDLGQILSVVEQLLQLRKIRDQEAIPDTF